MPQSDDIVTELGSYTYPAGVRFVEWLLPIGSADPTYLQLSASTCTDVSGIQYPDGPGDCLNPVQQPTCFHYPPGSGLAYGGTACGYCSIQISANCARFKAPPVRVLHLFAILVTDSPLH